MCVLVPGVQNAPQKGVLHAREKKTQKREEREEGGKKDTEQREEDTKTDRSERG